MQTALLFVACRLGLGSSTSVLPQTNVANIERVCRGRGSRVPWLTMSEDSLCNQHLSSDLLRLLSMLHASHGSTRAAPPHTRGLHDLWSSCRLACWITHQCLSHSDDSRNTSTVYSMEIACRYADVQEPRSELIRTRSSLSGWRFTSLALL